MTLIQAGFFELVKLKLKSGTASLRDRVGAVIFRVMFYWFLLLSLHYIIPVPIVESVNVVSDVQHLNDNHPLELHKILIGTENHSSSIDKIDQCEICVIFLDDLKAIINGTAFPAASQLSKNVP
uniref:Transmembrane protein n=1 Tax=Elaeophora elaphi TaxID=1147741 RepID=A0A0R3S0I6_9BILA